MIRNINITTLYLYQSQNLAQKIFKTSNEILINNTSVFKQSLCISSNRKQLSCCIQFIHVIQAKLHSLCVQTTPQKYYKNQRKIFYFVLKIGEELVGEKICVLKKQVLAIHA